MSLIGMIQSIRQLVGGAHTHQLMGRQGATAESTLMPTAKLQGLNLFF